jgi:hypothetical protein
MAYSKIDFVGAREALEKEIARAKQLDSYDARAFDGRVLKDLDRLVTSSLAIVDDYHKKVDDNHAVAKKTMDEMEALVKKRGKSLSDADVKVIETMQRTLERSATTIGETSGEVFKALADFRGGWPEKWRPLASNPQLIDPYVARRAKSIDEGKKRDTLKKRVEEYTKRGTDLQKVAKQMKSRGAALAGNEAAEITDFGKAVKAATDNFDVLAQRSRNSLEQVAKLNIKAKLDASNLKMNEQRLLNGRAEAKNARGTLKTASVKLATFKKMAANFDAANRKEAEKAYGVASKLVKAAESAEKKLSETEKKAVKIFETVKKLK